METYLAELSQVLSDYYQNFVILLPKLSLALLVLVIAYFLSRGIKSLVTKIITPRMEDTLLAGYLGSTAKVLVLTFAILLALQIVGLGKLAGGLMAGAGIGAFIIGFAFKDIGENFLAGIMLAFHRPFRIGDTVELNGKTGIVVSLNLRNSHIKTFDGKDIYIPNANVIKFPVVNYTIDGFIRQGFSVKVSNKADLNLIKKIVLEELKNVNGILKDEKKPFLAISHLVMQQIKLDINYWINTFDKEFSSGDLKIEAVGKILKRLGKEGIDVS